MERKNSYREILAGYYGELKAAELNFIGCKGLVSNSEIETAGRVLESVEKLPTPLKEAAFVHGLLAGQSKLTAAA